MLLSSYGAARGPAYLDATGIAAGREEPSHPARGQLPTRLPGLPEGSLGHSARTPPGAPPPQLGGVPRPPPPASGRANATRRSSCAFLAAGIVVTPSEAEKLARDEGHAALLAWLEASRRFLTLHARPVDTAAAPFPSPPPRPPSTPSLLPLRMPRCPCALRAPARAPLTHCSQSPRLLPTRCSRWHGRHHVRVLTPQRAIELLRAGCSPHARSVPLGSTTPVGHAPRVHSAALARRPCRPARLGRLAQPSLPCTGCPDRSAEPSGGQGGGTGGGVGRARSESAEPACVHSRAVRGSAARCSAARKRGR